MYLSFQKCDQLSRPSKPDCAEFLEMSCGIGLATGCGMRFGRVTKYALLLVPLFVCAARLHAQRAGSPSVMLQEANRCLSLVRASSRRRQQNEQNTRVSLVPNPESLNLNPSAQLAHHESPDLSRSA